MPRSSLAIAFYRVDDEICSQIACVVDGVLLERHGCLGSKITPAKRNVTFLGIFVLDRGEIVPVNQSVADIHRPVDSRLFGRCRIRSVVLR